MISARPHLLIKIMLLKHFALEVWVSIFSRFPRKVHITVETYNWPEHEILVLNASAKTMTSLHAITRTFASREH